LQLPTPPNSRVGYRSPPEATRFKKGASGNPRGRPKGSLNVATVLMRTLREKVVINQNGRRKTVTKLEAALKQLVDQAAAGDLRALRHLTALAHDAEAQQNARDAQRQDLGELDLAVMQGILQRFQGTEEEQNSSEGDNPL
jgi:Family of unknown function (DUF5681)